jgi:glutaredoxin
VTRGVDVTETTEKVIVYTLPECDVSERALADLRAEGLDVEERNVMRKKEWFDEALKFAITVPIVIRGSRVEVGWKGAYG